MHHNLLSSTTTTTMSPLTKPKKASPHHHPTTTPNKPTHTLCTKHTPSATLDLLILILVLFSGTFLITSYFTYLTHSLSLLLPPTLSLSSSTTIFLNTHFLYYLSFSLFLLISIFSLNFCCGFSKKCGKVGCKGLKKAVEFDLKMQGEECLRSGGKEVREINEMPWKGGSEGNNPDYECLRAELRKMAPPNGRAVLLFRAKCGCPVAKLEGWGPKRGRRHKKTLALNGGGDHR